MQKIHIRTYAMAETGDIQVTSWRRGEGIDLSQHYEGAGRDRRQAALGTTLDVFRHSNDRLAWALSSARSDVHAARTLQLLLGLFVDDADREPGDPRAL
jgi:hypothetical protein